MHVPDTSQVHTPSFCSARLRKVRSSPFLGEILCAFALGLPVLRNIYGSNNAISRYTPTCCPVVQSRDLRLEQGGIRHFQGVILPSRWPAPSLGRRRRSIIIVVNLKAVAALAAPDATDPGAKCLQKCRTSNVYSQQLGKCWHTANDDGHIRLDETWWSSRKLALRT